MKSWIEFKGTASIKNKDVMRFCLFLLLMVLFFSPCLASDNTTLIVFSRHTFRGISKNVGPQKISLPQYGIDISIPTLSYGEDATPQGLIIAEQFAAPGLQKAAALAVGAIVENKVFDGRWDEIRAELAAERTFWTGLYLRKGIEEIDAEHNPSIKFTGCQTVSGQEAVDVVSSDHPVKSCVPPDVYHQLLEASPDRLKLKTTFEDFLNTVRAAIGLQTPVGIPYPDYSPPPKNSLPPEYDQIAALASIIEMIADLGPPLPQIFLSSSDPGPLAQFGKVALQRGVDSLGIRFFTSEPSPLSDAVSVFPVNYMMSRPRGSHTIVVSHDNMMSALMSSLGIISSNSPSDDWAFFPIESYVFAFGSSNVSVVRMRVQIRDPDGAIPGDYTSQVVWNGSLAQWNEKVWALHQRAQTLYLGDKGNACLKEIKECKAEEIDVVFHSRPSAPPPGATPPPAEPCSSFTDLIHAVRKTDLQPRAENSLLRKLRAAAVFLDQGDEQEAHNTMERFFRKLNRLKHKGQLDAATADALAECGHKIDQSIVEDF
jgi:hypothetical protein